MPRPTQARRRLTGARSVVVGLGVAAVAAAAAAGSAATAGPAPCGATGALSSAGSTLTCTYSTVGSDVFTVPAGVTQASVVATGATGGHYFIAGDAAHGGSPAGDITGPAGGSGGQAAGTLALTPGQVLQIDVAGRGANGTAASRSGGMMNGPSGGSGGLGGFGGSNGGVAGGAGDAKGASGGTAFNGGNGSGGGGSSDVRIDAAGCATLMCGLSTRALIGAGGGGGGGSGGQGNALGGGGGNGGGLTGADGSAQVAGGGRGFSGTGATQTAGGTGGLNAARHTAGQDPTDPRLGGDGADGTLGLGGVGGTGNFPCTDPKFGGQCGPTSTTSGGGAGGGAGGGLFGGGGGSGGGSPFGGGGGAGGGGGGASGYVTPNATASSLTAGVNGDTINGGNGQVTVTFTPPPPAPVVTTGSPSGVTGTTAGLSGTVNPEGGPTTFVFEFGPTLSFGSISPPVSAGSGVGDVAVTGSLAGLTPGTTYYYRVVAANPTGTTFGSVMAVTTTAPASAPVALTGAATGVGNTGATLNGQVNPRQQQTAFAFEYGTTLSFGSLTPVVALDAANQPEAVSSALSGLSPSTTYYYRVVATNATGTAAGAVMSFTTGPTGPPSVTTGAASNVAALAVTLSGTVDAHGEATSFAFEYGTTNSFGSLSAVDRVDPIAGPQAVSLMVTGLAPSTTYLYRLVATNADGTTAGIVKSFTTPAASG